MLETAILSAAAILMCCAVTWSTVSAAAQGRLSRNAGAGIRTTATMRSDKAWRAAHQAALPVVNRLVLTCLGLAATIITTALWLGQRYPMPIATLEFATFLILLCGAIPVTHAANEAATRV